MRHRNINLGAAGRYMKEHRTLLDPLRLDSIHYLSCSSPINSSHCFPHNPLSLCLHAFVPLVFSLQTFPHSPSLPNFSSHFSSQSLSPDHICTLLPAFLLGSFCPPLSCFITSATSFNLFSFFCHSEWYYYRVRPSLPPLQTLIPAL